jgi:membrane-associated protein
VSHALLALGRIAAEVHRHFHLPGAPIGYVGVAVGAVISWAGVPGAGEAALVAAAAFAARHQLDIGMVLAIAWLSATFGGVAGWLVGRHIGAPVAAAPGPFLRLRLRGLRAGERFFERFGMVAVFLTPAWVAGVHGLRPAKFLVANALAALAWVAMYGLSVYLIGPSIADTFGDAGLAGTLVIATVAAIAVVVAIVRARRVKRG